MIPLETFLSCVKENESRIRGYESGHDGSDGYSDCIGLIIGAVRLAGGKWPGVHGSNWAARNAMSTLERTDPWSMFLGEIVYKDKEPGENGYSLPDKYKSSGDLLDYYHVGVVTCMEPLIITHCTNVPGGIKEDKAINNWHWGGELKYVDYKKGGTTMEPIYQAKVHADNDYPVRMREQPRTNSEILAKIPQGTIVDVLGIVGSNEGDWGFIRYGGKTGYMMTKFLEPVKEEEEADEENVTIRRAQLEYIAATLYDLADSIREMIGGRG